MLGLLLFLSSLPPSARPIVPVHAAQAEGRFYPQTGHTLAPQFVSFFDSNGGLPLFGYPVTDATMDGGYLVQWTERERLEWHPENAGTRFEVELGLLGSELVRGLNGPHFTPSTSSLDRMAGAEAASDSEVFFPETGQRLSDPFLTYWRENGGLAVFGYPVSTRFRDENGIDVQWFQRARFEYHPDLPDDFKVTLGLVGDEALNQLASPLYEVQLGDSPAPDAPLQLGISQGGESSDPGFFDNIKDTGQALGPGLVRLDNIYDFYNVVHSTGPGTVWYDWTQLDRVIDAIRAMGKEPFLCLSYMPEAFSASGTSRVQPPADFSEWSALVKATVTHLNVDRKLHIRYWEVWNEPNQWDFWQGSFADYLKLYDTTVQAITSVDPSVSIGGPSFSLYEPMGLGQFLSHESQTPGGRVDFLSWHAYGRTPDQLAAEIREARGLVAQFPNLHPQLFLTEFNVLQGGDGDTSINANTDRVNGAIDLLRSIESMSRERLDRAFLFELKDGQGPTDFWGKWGILTYGGQPKPIYYALQAYVKHPPGTLPATVNNGPLDGTIGLMGFGGPSASTILLWYTGSQPARIKVRLPESFAETTFDPVLFANGINDPRHNGPGPLKHQPAVNAGDLLFTMPPESLLILNSESR